MKYIKRTFLLKVLLECWAIFVSDSRSIKHIIKYTHLFCYLFFLIDINIINPDKKIFKNNHKFLIKIITKNHYNAIVNNVDNYIFVRILKRNKIYYIKHYKSLLKKQITFSMNLLYNLIKKNELIFFINLNYFSPNLETYYFELWGLKVLEMYYFVFTYLNMKNFSQQYLNFVYTNIITGRPYSLVWILDIPKGKKKVSFLTNYFLPIIGSTNYNSLNKVYDYNLIGFKKQLNNEMWLHNYFYLNRLIENEKKINFKYSFFFNLYRYYSIFFKNII